MLIFHFAIALCLLAAYPEQFLLVVSVYISLVLFRWL